MIVSQKNCKIVLGYTLVDTFALCGDVMLSLSRLLQNRVEGKRDY